VAKEGSKEWLTYEFDSEKTVSSTTVYWFDDKPWGGCKVPENWTVYYKDKAGE
jgi:hypothetical protein